MIIIISANLLLLLLSADIGRGEITQWFLGCSAAAAHSFLMEMMSQMLRLILHPLRLWLQGDFNWPMSSPSFQVVE